MIDIAAGDQQFKSEINPMGFVPAVKFPQNDAALFESLPIMELLDSLFPENPILPKDPFERARKGFPLLNQLAFSFLCSKFKLRTLKPS